MKGRNLIIDCQTEGYPAPIHHWKKLRELNPAALSSPSTSTSGEYITIVSGPHIHVLENGSLAVIDVTKHDEGVYMCESSNGIGITISASSNIVVNSPVNFDKNFDVIKVIKNTNTMLTCNASGDKPIEINWSKDRVIINQSPSSLTTITRSFHQSSSSSSPSSRLIKDLSESNKFNNENCLSKQ